MYDVSIENNFNTECTIVTLLLDIGRDKWYPPYHRNFNYYLKHFKKTLSLKCCMVTFVEEKLISFVIERRKKIDPNLEYTKIYPITLSDLPMFNKLHCFKDIIENQNYRNFINKSKRPLRPEAHIPEYSIIIHSKTALVKNICIENPFHTPYFMWIDAGLCRENFPNNLRFAYYPNPAKIIKLNDNKIYISYLSRSKAIDYSNTIEILTSGIARIAGGWFAGTREALILFDHYCQEILKEILTYDIIDSEQAIFYICYIRHKELFVLIDGDWYDGFLSFR